ncbi:hypothetical protein TPA0910_87690 [Streptomyces hygroscopicus subsp. sporocinereus]|uniref:Terminase small subunit n=1 Tax=Streptomyces hygroscopicus TaxID=1912 RepID=A0ABQ3UFU4_STRHY|nr:hypothetical protein [Streptomyces hygroscopicus]GHJ34336.1 hypothetical protein TPA0910_87690 [Streptomyces hygroscopicus]
MGVSKADRALVEERRRELISLRRERVSFEDPRIIALGYTSSNAARRDFYRAMQARRDATDAEVTAYREEQTEIIESLLDTYLPKALDGDIKAGEMTLKLLERSAKLNGWEAVLKAEVSGPGGGAVPLGATLNELNALIATAGELGPASDFVSSAEAEDDDSDS